jgi:hypothetical protein
MPGPMPNPTRRRQNQPTIAMTCLPAEGRKGPLPRPPRWITLNAAGNQWWRWAWKTPQAAAWESKGMEVFVARRAKLEDLFDELPPEKHSAVYGQMVALDRQLGLTPAAMLALRWQVAADEVGEQRTEKAAPAAPRRLTAVDPAVNG